MMWIVAAIIGAWAGLVGLILALLRGAGRHDPEDWQKPREVQRLIEDGYLTEDRP